MATIRDTLNDKSYPLRAHHTFGRSAGTVDTQVTSPIASRIHLALEWDGEQWQARDLSKNGTWLGSRRIAPGENVSLKLGDQLHLGSPDMPPLELTDDSPPRSGLVGITADTPFIQLEPFRFLPDQESPEAVLLYSYHRRGWSLYAMDDQHGQPGSELPLEHGDTVQLNDHQWRVFLAESEQATELNLSPEQHLEELEFIFDLSLDEENTSLTLRNGSEVTSLGERSHHYLLLHLARQRAEAAACGLDSKSQGWVDNEQLSKDLGIEMSHINIMIFRARKQIADNLPGALDSERLVERGKGRMRFGCPRFRIYKGERLAYALPAAETA